jgi:hypothetical protein
VAVSCDNEDELNNSAEVRNNQLMKGKTTPVGKLAKQSLHRPLCV